MWKIYSDGLGLRLYFKRNANNDGSFNLCFGFRQEDYCLAITLTEEYRLFSGWEVIDDGNGFFRFQRKPLSPEPKEQEAKPAACAHEWADYVGLTQAYQYCVKCDEKSGV